MTSISNSGVTSLSEPVPFSLDEWRTILNDWTSKQRFRCFFTISFSRTFYKLVLIIQIVSIDFHLHQNLVIKQISRENMTKVHYQRIEFLATVSWSRSSFRLQQIHFKHQLVFLEQVFFFFKHISFS